MTTEYFEPLTVLKRDNVIDKREQRRNVNRTTSFVDIIEKPRVPFELGLQHKRYSDAYESYFKKKATDTELDSLQATDYSTRTNNTVPFIPMKHETLITVQHGHNNTVSNFTSSVSMKRNSLNCNNASTKTNAIKPNQISRSIKDIQGMLVSNLNSKSTCVKKSSDAKSSEPLIRKESFNSLQKRDSHFTYINIDDNGNSDVLPNKPALSDCGIAQNYTVHDLAKPILKTIRTEMPSDSDKGALEKIDYENESGNICSEMYFSGD